MPKQLLTNRVYKSMFVIFVAFLMISCQQSTNQTIEKENEDIGVQEGNPLLFSINNSRESIGTTPKFASQFVLNRDQFLTIHFDLDEPLIHSLQALAPNLSQDALLNQGNFQFTIVVDDKVAYVENLNRGAGLEASKTTQLNHAIPLITPERIDFWGWFMWLKFMKMADGRDLLDNGKHTLRIEVRSYLQDDTLKVGPLLAAGNLSVNVDEKTIDEQLVPIQEIEVGSGWTLSKANFNRTKVKALNRKIAEKRFEKINGIVVVKNGKLLIEEYFNGSARDSLHDPRSVGKTFASTMMGIAIEDGYIQNVNAVLSDFYNLRSFANFSQAKESISIQSLLTMSSGFLGDDNDYESPGYEEKMYPTDDWVKFVLDLPLDSTKVMETDYTYFTGGAVLLGDIINTAVPGSLVSYADEKLFAPLGITNYKWQFTPQGVGNTAGGIRLRAIDFAKFGQLYKNKGKWNDKQLITEDWVEKSLSKQVIQHNQDRGFYGYLFWNKVYTVDGKDYEVAFCTGNGGNKIFIFKDIPFVIVITSSAYNLPYAHTDVDKMMIDYILPAVLTE